jgi:hypothetical protein
VALLLKQHTLTVVARIVDLALTRARIETARQEGSLALEEPTLGIHFARVVLIDEASDSPYASWLVLESCFDAPCESRTQAVEHHLAMLVARRGAALRGLFAGCRGFSEASDDAALERALRSALSPSTAEYMGHVDRDLARIRLEHEARRILIAVATEAPSNAAAHAPRPSHERSDGRERSATVPARALASTLRERVRSMSRSTTSPLHALGLDGPPPKTPDPSRRQAAHAHPRRAWLSSALGMLDGIVPRPVGAPVCVALAALGAPAVFWVLLRGRTQPEHDAEAAAIGRGPQTLRQLSESAAGDGLGAQNALTHLVALRPGLGNRTVLKLIHRYIDHMAREHFNHAGQLGGIPSIHFAKWLLIDEGRRLLFLSNYDGSWESYLGDFVDRAALGLNMAWCLTEGYPRVSVLARGGADDEERFKDWARHHQIPTALFYSAYPSSTVATINNNTRLREGLHVGDEGDAEAWLRRIT